MAFELIAILATFACVSANYVPVGVNLPYAGYGSVAIIPEVQPYGSSYPGYTYAPQVAVQNALPVLTQQVQTPLIGNYLQPRAVPATAVLPAGKTTLTETYVSTPTYVTSHVSKRVHTDEPARPFYNNHAYGKHVINDIDSLSYAVNYAAPAPYGVKHGW